MLALYDLEDNLVTIFNDYKECAKYFNTSIGCIRSHISRFNKGILKKKLNKENHKWYKLYQFGCEKDEFL